MRIGIEAQRIFRSKKHGMDIYAIELIKKLQQIDNVNEYFIFVRDKPDYDIIPHKSNFKIVQIDRGFYPFWEQVHLVRAVKQFNIDVLHCTSNTAPLAVKIPMVVTVHDIIYLEKLNLTKGTLYQIFGNLYRRWNVPRVVRKAKKLLTVSEFEKGRIASRFKFSNGKVHAIYNGVGDRFVNITDEEKLRSIRIKYNLPEKYILTFGNTDPKKNLEGLLRGLSILNAKGKLNFQIVMLDVQREYVLKLLTKIGDIGVLDSICFPGYVVNTELPAIYSMAELFVYPSLRESFGIPILEAISCKTPVVTSSTSSMPEVGGDAAYYIDPFNPESIADGIFRLLNDADKRAYLVNQGVNQVKKFSWLTNARQTLQIYSEIQSNN